jgi:hypothetical protein
MRGVRLLAYVIIHWLYPVLCVCVYDVFCEPQIVTTYLLIYAWISS